MDATRGTPLEKSSEVSLVIDASIVDEMENVPQSTASERKIDYKSVNEAYKQFWATCEDAYVVNVGEKVELISRSSFRLRQHITIDPRKVKLSRTWSTI